MSISKKAFALISLIALASIIMGMLAFAEPASAKAKGPVKRSGKLYLYKSNGKLAKGKEGIRTYGRNKYYVLKNGQIKKGWNIKGKNLYYFGTKGKMVRNKRVDGITLLPSGKAEMKIKKNGKTLESLDAKLRYLCIKDLKRLGVWNKSRKAKLRAAYNFLARNGKNRVYKYKPTKNNHFGDKQWKKKTALRMISTRRGNCFGWACALAAYAWTSGYKPYVVRMRVRGFRDGAADNFTKHGANRINGRFYDAENPAEWHPPRRVFATKGIPYPHKQVRKGEPFWKEKGTIESSVKKLSGNITKIGKRYYHFDGSGKSLKGVFYDKKTKKLYKFSKKDENGYYCTADTRDELTEAIERGSLFSDLRDLVGSPSSKADDCDKYASITYFYKHFAVQTRLDEDEERVIHKIFTEEDVEI